MPVPRVSSRLNHTTRVASSSKIESTTPGILAGASRDRFHTTHPSNATQDHTEGCPVHAGVSRWVMLRWGSSVGRYRSATVSGGSSPPVPLADRYSGSPPSAGLGPAGFCHHVLHLPLRFGEVYTPDSHPSPPSPSRRTRVVHCHRVRLRAFVLHRPLSRFWLLSTPSRILSADLIYSVRPISSPFLAARK